MHLSEPSIIRMRSGYKQALWSELIDSLSRLKSRMVHFHDFGWATQNVVAVGLASAVPPLLRNEGVRTRARGINFPGSRGQRKKKEPGAATDLGGWINCGLEMPYRQVEGSGHLTQKC